MLTLSKRILTVRFYSAGLEKAMQKHCIIPDVIDTAPSQILEITFPSGAKVDQGNIIAPTEAKDIPSVKWKCDSNVFHTLCKTDPDAPSRKDPQFREWHHWLVVNIPGDQVSKGETLSEYIGAGPPKGTGLHRYVYLVYKQPGKLSFKERKLTNQSGTRRGKFSIKNFAIKYKLGHPIAGNFYQAEFDEYVPILHKQLGLSIS